MLKNFSIQNLLQQMQNVIPNYCDKCGHKHDKADLELISQEGTKANFRLSCSNCGNSYMVMVQSPMDGVFTARKYNARKDLTASEISKFSRLESINKEEILDAFIAIKDVNTLEELESLFNSDIDSSTNSK